MQTKSYWTTSSVMPRFDSLGSDLETDVVVIGAGLTGITAAYLFRKAGLKVVLLERQRCAGADTGHTTAHLTYVTDERLHKLVHAWGREGAKAVWQAGAAAIDQIEAIVRGHEIKCEFARVPGYLHGKLRGSDASDRDSLKRDAELARELGFEAELLDAVPYAQRPGVRFAAQAKFHPLKYLARLLSLIPGEGSFVFENTEASEVEPDPLIVHAKQYKIRCRHLFIATHNPLMGKTGMVRATLFQTKLALYTSYVLGVRLAPRALPEALFWDTSDPYFYLRVDQQDDHAYAIFGGLDHKTGQEKDVNQVFKQLEEELRDFLPEAQVQHRWLGQVIATNDGLPFIGESDQQQFIATGFCGNGFTFGTLSAMMARDRYLGRNNAWFDLLAVRRKKFHGGTWRYLKENSDFPYYLVRDRLAAADDGSPDDLKAGEGKILRLQGRKAAVCRDGEGRLHVLSPVCTHLKCIVHWNAADRTWDCPCHGSRFQATGEVFSGPAEAPLSPIAWEDVQKAA